MPTLISADIGNVNLKYRQHGAQWTIEPSLVRVPAGAAYSFDGAAPPRELRYLSGPAQIGAAPFVVGTDAIRGGLSDLTIIGAGEIRAQSAPYLLLHLYSILTSLPPQVREAEVVFAGGLPVDDHKQKTVADILKQRLVGVHHLQWGEEAYRISIVELLLVAQPIAALATLMFSPDGQPVGEDVLARTRLALDVGGGTTDYTGRRGFEALPGAEGGVALGSHSAAAIAVALVQQRFPTLRELTAQDILAAMRSASPVVHVAGKAERIEEEITTAQAQLSRAILATVLPKWRPYLATGEVLLFGGGGSDLAGALSQEIGKQTRVTLLPNPVLRVADGIERMARRRFRGTATLSGS